MGRKGIKINPKSGERLRQIRKEKGITLEMLAELTHYTAPYLSLVETGKKPMSLELENAVLNLFPEYRGSWLSGLDDIKTLADWNDFLESVREKDREVQEESLLALMHLLQYRETEIRRKEDGGVLIIGGYTEGTDYFVGVELNSKQVLELINEIRDFADMRIRWLFHHPPFPGSYLMRDSEGLQGGKHVPEEQ